jgi:NADH dehydrogenase (ubiquinone) 1 beta subcomplex subunit 7
MGGHDHHFSPEAMPKADQDLELLKKHHVALNVRDNCAHLLVGLNECRRETLFNPDRCQHQRHIYEECQYIAWTARVEAKKAAKVAAVKAAAAETATL